MRVSILRATIVVICVLLLVGCGNRKDESKQASENTLGGGFGGGDMLLGDPPPPWTADWEPPITQLENDVMVFGDSTEGSMDDIKTEGYSEHPSFDPDSAVEVTQNSVLLFFKTSATETQIQQFLDLYDLTVVDCWYEADGADGIAYFQCDTPICLPTLAVVPEQDPYDPTATTGSVLDNTKTLYEWIGVYQQSPIIDIAMPDMYVLELCGAADTPNDPWANEAMKPDYDGYQWYLDGQITYIGAHRTGINVRGAWQDSDWTDPNNPGEDVTVALFDSGTWTAHPDFGRHDQAQNRLTFHYYSVDANYRGWRIGKTHKYAGEYTPPNRDQYLIGWPRPPSNELVKNLENGSNIYTAHGTNMAGFIAAETNHPDEYGIAAIPFNRVKLLVFSLKAKKAITFGIWGVKSPVSAYVKAVRCLRFEFPDNGGGRHNLQAYDPVVRVVCTVAGFPQSNLLSGSSHPWNYHAAEWYVASSIKAAVKRDLKLNDRFYAMAAGNDAVAAVNKPGGSDYFNVISGCDFSSQEDPPYAPLLWENEDAPGSPIAGSNYGPETLICGISDNCTTTDLGIYFMKQSIGIELNYLSQSPNDLRRGFDDGSDTRDDGICLGWNGTSAATAQLSGVAALMYYYDNTMNRFTVRDILADQNNQVLLGDHPEINGLVKVPEVLDAVRDQRPCNCWVP